MKKKKIILSFFVLILILSVIGISYAYWHVTLSQKKVNKITGSCLSLSLENEKNAINLTNAYPILNEEGKKLTPYSFSITNTCDLFASYTVNLEILEGSTLPIKYISSLLNNEKITKLASLEEAKTTRDGAISSKVLAKGSLGSGDTIDYALRLWMSEDVTPSDIDAMNKVFQSKIVVIASPSSYSPVEAGYSTLADAILSNEYQTIPEISKQKIASKQTPDFSKTAPIIIWSENKSQSLTSVTTMMPHPDLVALKDTDEKFKNLTHDNVLLTLGTGYKFDSEHGSFSLTNTSLLDPTTLNYNGSDKYYYCRSYFTTSIDDIVNISHTTSGCSDIYEISSATKKDDEYVGTMGNKYRAQKFTLQALKIDQKENESDKSDKGLYSIEDGDGTSYYYRGYVNNNYVKFAGYFWQIIRLNGDGSVRLLYVGKNSNISSIGTSAFNTLRNNPAYAGYMYGTTLNESYEKTTANEVDSDIKKKLDNWYKENIANTANETLIKDAGFCNDRSLSSGDGTSITSRTIYKQNVMMNQTSLLSLICFQEQDLFTLNTNTKGNKALTYPIGLITTNELVLAGFNPKYLNKSSYAYSREPYWTMSPSLFNKENSTVSLYGLNNTGTMGSYWDTSSLGVRPVINIKGDAKISGGIGTSNSPYEIVSE